MRSKLREMDTRNYKNSIKIDNVLPKTAAIKNHVQSLLNNRQIKINRFSINSWPIITNYIYSQLDAFLLES